MPWYVLMVVLVIATILGRVFAKRVFDPWVNRRLDRWNFARTFEFKPWKSLEATGFQGLIESTLARFAMEYSASVQQQQVVRRQGGSDPSWLTRVLIEACRQRVMKQERRINEAHLLASRVVGYKCDCNGSIPAHEFPQTTSQQHETAEG